jgi:Rho-type GTPase-activating protein 1/2
VCFTLSSFSGQTDATLQRSLTSRFDNLKAQYKRELEPLVQQRDALLREIHELKEERNICLEETTALNARNEELADLNSRTAQVESGARGPAPRAWSPMPASMGAPPAQLHTPSTPQSVSLPAAPPSSGQTSATLSFGASTVMHEERDEPRATPTDKKKWFKPSKDMIKLMSDGPPVPEKEFLRHNFQQLTVLRFARCDHCGDKMWGTQLRCNGEYPYSNDY